MQASIGLHILFGPGSIPPEVTVRDPTFRPAHRTDEPTERVKNLLAEAQIEGAAQTALDAYGAEIFGFLIGVLQDFASARKVYAVVSQRAAGEIATFAWHTSLRVWLYGLARAALSDRRERARAIAPPHAETLATVSRRPIGVTRAIAALRRELTEEERELLILRIDRGLDWTQLATTTLREGAPADEISRETRDLQARMAVLLDRVKQAASRHRRIRSR